VRVMHMQPANPAGLETDAERQVGLKNWDGAIEPATSAWQAGQTYNTAVEGVLPSSGAPWTVVVGMTELIDGGAGGRTKEVQLTDAGTSKRFGASQWVVLASK